MCSLGRFSAALNLDNSCTGLNCNSCRHECILGSYQDERVKASARIAVIINMLLIAMGITLHLGGTDCVNCPNGKDNINGGVCDNCDAGTYDVNTVNACQTCSLNEYTDQVEQSSCVSCSNHKHVVDSNGDYTASGGTDCVNCPNGKDNINGDVCDNCDAGTYADNTGNACQNCP